MASPMASIWLRPMSSASVITASAGRMATSTLDWKLPHLGTCKHRQGCNCAQLPYRSMLPQH